jgi:aerobic-type carbon monoxide dehydrogenase small subunit (CoxS/CutS family)
MLTLTVNGQSKQVDVDNDTPLLWVDAVEKGVEWIAER